MFAGRKDSRNYLKGSTLQIIFMLLDECPNPNNTYLMVLFLCNISLYCNK